MKQLVGALLAFVMTFAVQKEASAATVTFDSFGTSLGGGGLSVQAGSIDQGLLFTAQTSGLLDAVSTLWAFHNAADTISLTLYSFDGTSLGAALDTVQADVPGATFAQNVLEFNGWSSSLVAGQSYGLIASGLSGGLNAWAYTSDAVANSLGRYFTVADGTEFFSNSLTPIASISVSTSPVPLPATAWLLFGSIGVLGVLRRRRFDA